MHYTYCDSPIGALLLAGDEKDLQILGFPKDKNHYTPHESWVKSASPFTGIKEQLRAYFNAELTTFSVALAPQGTAFQRAVWQALQTIPYGETCSYSDIAHKIGNPKAVRAVGAANGRNPIALIIPCHRVIGSDGSLTGFGGGLPAKRLLLNLEGPRQGELGL